MDILEINRRAILRKTSDFNYENIDFKSLFLHIGWRRKIYATFLPSVRKMDSGY